MDKAKGEEEPYKSYLRWRETFTTFSFDMKMKNKGSRRILELLGASLSLSKRWMKDWILEFLFSQMLYLFVEFFIYHQYSRCLFMCVGFLFFLAFPE